MKYKKIKKLQQKLEPFDADKITINNFEGMKHYITPPVVIHAVQLNYPEGFKVTIGDMVFFGRAGDYLVLLTDEEKIICPKENFDNLYLLIEKRGK